MPTNRFRRSPQHNNMVQRSGLSRFAFALKVQAGDGKFAPCWPLMRTRRRSDGGHRLKSPPRARFTTMPPRPKQPHARLTRSTVPRMNSI